MSQLSYRSLTPRFTPQARTLTCECSQRSHLYLLGTLLGEFNEVQL